MSPQEQRPADQAGRNNGSRVPGDGKRRQERVSHVGGEPASGRLGPDYQEALSWLGWWRPDGSWTLVEIEEMKKPTGRTFAKGEEAEILKWLEFYGRKSNLYFCVNPLLYALDKKPRRADVASLDWLHVDVDPRAGEDLEEEQKRILAMLQEFSPRPAGISTPSARSRRRRTRSRPVVRSSAGGGWTTPASSSTAKRRT